MGKPVIGKTLEEWNIIGERQCTRCKRVRPIDDFQIRTRKVGNKRYKHYDGYCLQCWNLIQKANKWRIPRKQYEDLLENSKGLCEICQQSYGSSPRLDHSHSTGVVRGLLCNRCNVGLAMIEDNEENAQRALNYLSRYKTAIPDENAAWRAKNLYGDEYNIRRRKGNTRKRKEFIAKKAIC